MTKTNVGIDKAKFNNYVASLENDLQTCNRHIIAIKNHVMTIANGDGKEAYWSGTLARQLLYKIKKNLIVDNQNLDALYKYSQHLKKYAKKASTK